jgi:hypothetical protein
MCRCSLLLDMRHLFRYTLSYEGQVWLQHEDNKPLADYLREINPFESFGGLDYDGTTESASFGNNRLPSRMPSLPPFNVPESAEMRCISRGAPTSSRPFVRVIGKESSEPMSMDRKIVIAFGDDEAKALLRLSLTDLRSQLARRLNVPAYSVLSANDLEATVNAAPVEVAQLSGLPMLRT